MSLDDPFVTTCPQCGGDDLRWRVRRNSGSFRSSERSFVWMCRECGVAWVESIPLDVVENDEAHDSDTY